MDGSSSKKRAFATMLTSESYLPGALTLLKSLKRHHPHIPVFCLSTLSPSSKAAQLLETQFDKVVLVSPIKFEENKENLKILGRLDLDLTLTKLHVFGLDTETVDQVVFLDADTLVLHPIAPAIFEYVDEAVFAAAPDIGWPDCFNSGVFATRPHPTLFASLLEYAKSNASFDGGDQGLLNSFFSTWAQRDSVLTSRLPFTFNVTPSPYYTYMPAFVHFARDLKIAHFIGPAKPWKWNRGKDGSVLNQKGASEQTLDLVGQWWRVFDEYSIEKLLDGFVLDRDWSRYAVLRAAGTSTDEASASEEQEKTPAPAAAPAVHDELSLDLDNYRVGWRSSELGPYRGNRGRSRSPQKKSHSPTKQRDNGKSPSSSAVEGSRTGNVLILSANRPPSPTRKLISSSSKLTAASSSPTKKKGSADGSIDDYVVGWNLEELKGVSTSEASGHALDQPVSPITADGNSPISDAANSVNFGGNPAGDGRGSEKTVEAAVKRPVIKTDSFTITEKGSWALPQDAAAPIMCRARPEFNPLTASATAGSSVQPTSAPAPQAPAPPQTPSPAPAPAPPQQKPQPKQEAPAVPAPKPATPAPKPQPPAVTYNNDCLGLANQARQAVNLPPMTWSSALQNSATTYAKKLQSNNPNSLVLVHSGLAGLGENLYANSGGGTCVDANKAWIAEKSLYNGQPVGQGNFGAYGHYTQIITKSVSQVGCNPDLSAGSYIVCHYNFEQIAGSIAGR